MPLDTTVGGVLTDSYNSLEEFTAFVSGRLHVPATFLPTDSEKENGLRIATKWLDKLCYLGTAVTSTQKRKFPMSGLLTQNGFPLPTNIHPEEIKDALNELTYLMLVSNRLGENTALVQGIERLKAGPVEFSFRDDGVKTVNVIPDSVKLMIPQAWLCPADRVVPPTTTELVFETV
jgi:hypothetical protein